MRPLSFLRITFALFFTYFDLSAQVIPSDRFYDWSGAGFRGTSPDYSNSINIMHLGAVNDSSAPVEAYIQQAIDSLNGRQGVIYFPAGNYLVNATIVLPDSVVLKGAGADSTTIIFKLNGAPNDCIDVLKNQDEVLDPFTRIISGFEKGSVSLTVSDGSSFVPNAYAEIRQDNGSWDSQPATWAEKSVGQIVKIVSATGNTLQL